MSKISSSENNRDDYPPDPLPAIAAMIGLILTVVGVWLFVQWYTQRTCAELCAVTQDASVYANHTCTCVRGRERYVPPGGVRW